VSTTDPQALAETSDRFGAYPRLSGDQMDSLAAYAQRRRVQPGELLFRDGDPSCDFYVILAGKVAVVDGYGTPEERIVSVHGPGRFLGELSLLTGEAVFLSSLVIEPGEVLVVPTGRLRELVTRDQTVGDLILRAYLIRRSILIGLGAGMRIIGSRYSPDARRLRDFAARNRLPHRWIDLEEDAGAEALLRRLGVTPEDTPAVILHGTQLLRNPSNAALARALGLHAPSPQEAVSDLIVIGAGPAGLAAAVYAASEGLTTAALDAVATGGQAGTSPRIENYLGFPAGISGAELADRAAIQARKFGAHITVPGTATALHQCDGYCVVTLEDGSTICGRTALIATGARYRKLGAARLDEFEGTSVYYAATQTEVQSCRGDQVSVVGGGNSAGQASLALAQHAANVRLLVRGGDLGEHMSRYLVNQIEHDPRIEVMLHTEVRELAGDAGRLRALVVEDNRTGEQRLVEAVALFVFIGAAPCTDWLRDEVALDDDGFVRTGTDAPRQAPGDDAPGGGGQPRTLETSRQGIFAVGDVRSGSIKRVASAVGEGAMAVRLVHERMRFG